MSQERKAIQNLADQYAPGIKLPRGGFAAYDVLSDHAVTRGHMVALDNVTGEFVILDENEKVLARSLV